MLEDLQKFIDFLHDFCCELWGKLQSFYHQFKDDELVQEIMDEE